MLRPRRLRAALAVASCLVTMVTAMSACSGPRATLSKPAQPPTGGDRGVPVGDAGVDAVLADLERPMTVNFTATYSILRKLGTTRAEATVSRGPLATSVTIGDVRFVAADTDHTCLLSTQVCEDKINDARISDLGLASTFWRDAPARTLRVTYGRRAAPATASDETVAGRAAHCVTVPVGTGSERYCSLADGALARWDTAYVTVELTSWEPNLRPALFDLPIEKKADGS